MSPTACRDFLRRDGLRLAVAIGAGERDRAGEHPQHVEQDLVGGHAQADRAIGRDDFPDSCRQLGGQAVAVMAIDHERDGPRPAAPGQPAGHGSHVGHEVDRFFGALDGDREGGIPVAVLQVPQPLDRLGMAGAGADAVDRFRRKRH